MPPWAPMLSTPGGIPARQHEYAFEFKWDGMRALVELRKGRISILSRNDLEQAPRFPEFAGLAAAYKDRHLVLDGEIVVFEPGGVRPDFGRLQQRFGLTDPVRIAQQARAHPCHFLAFDVLGVDGKDLTGLTFRERRKRLEALGFQGANWATTPSVEGDGDAVLRTSREHGFEGIMAKRLDSLYRPGLRSDAWIKIRNRPRQEFVVGGWSEGEGSRHGTIGSLWVGHYRTRGKGGKLHFIGRVGSGLKDADLDWYKQELRRLAADRDPFDGYPPDVDPAECHFVKPVLVVEVEFNGLARGGVLRQPSYKGRRTDKDPKDVVWEQSDLPRPG